MGAYRRYGRGYSNYGVLVHNSQDFLLQNVDLRATKAGRGSIGETPGGMDEFGFKMEDRAEDASNTLPGDPT